MEDREFERLMAICRLKLSDADKGKIKSDIENVIEYFDLIDKIETGNLKEAYHPIHIEGKTREDTASSFSNIDGLLNNTKTYRFYVVGPRV